MSLDTSLGSEMILKLFFREYAHMPFPARNVLFRLLQFLIIELNEGKFLLNILIIKKYFCL